MDEVLAVGDTEFQKKCLGKMGEVAKGGRTVLFVSHNMAAIQLLCNQGVLLESGCTVGIQPVENAVSQYLRSRTSGDLPYWSDSSLEKLGITRVLLTDEFGHKVQVALCGHTLDVKLDFKVRKTDKELSFAVVVYDNLGAPVCACQSNISSNPSTPLDTIGCAICMIPRLPLSPGLYYLDVSLDASGQRLDFIERAIQFQVEGGDFFETGRLPNRRWGALVLDHKWHVYYGIVPINL